MKNPCNSCIVKSMCTLICAERVDYSNYTLDQLSDFSKKHIYSINGIKRKNIKMRIKKQFDYYVKMAKQNNEGINAILDRNCRSKIF